MFPSFRKVLEANLAEFQKNMLLEVARLEETFTLEAQPSKQNVRALMSASATTSVGHATEDGEDDDNRLPKQKKRNAPAEPKNEKQVKFERGPKIPIKQWDSDTDCLLSGCQWTGIAGNTGYQPPDIVGKIQNHSVAIRDRQSLTSAAPTGALGSHSGCFTDPIVVASCPESFHDEVEEICIRNNFAKAFGQKGDMVDTLSGDDWVGKWEAKVVISAVTKVRTMEANHVRIICIQGGKHCDKEVEAQPRLKAAILQEFGGNLRVSLEWLEMDEFRERYVCKAAADAMKIYLCHKQSNSVDAVLSLKLQIEERLPETIFYNVGLEEDRANGKTEVEVMSCNHFVIFLTKDALLEPHVLSQIQFALLHKKQCVLVMETDRAYGGVNLNEEVAKLEDDDFKEVFKKNIMIPWSRNSSVQEVSLDKIVASLTAGTEGNRWMAMLSGPSLEDEFISTMFDPSFHLFCNCAGIALPGAWRTTYVRGFVTMGLACLSSVLTICLQFLPQDGWDRDIRDSMSWPMVFVVVSFVSYIFQRCVATQEVKELFGLHKHDLDLRRRLHVVSRQLTNVGLVLLVILFVFILMEIAAYSTHMQETSSTSQFDLAVRRSCRIVALFAGTLCTLQGSCLAPAIHCLFFVLLMSFASTFSQLHPQIQDFGIARSVEQGMIIHVTDSSFVRFQRMYIDVWKKVRVIFSWMACALILLYVVWITNFVLHVVCVLDLAKNGKPVNAKSGFTKDGLHLTLRPLSVFIFDAFLLVPFFYTYHWHRFLSQCVARLIFTNRFTRVAISNFVNELIIDLPVFPMSERFRLDASMTQYVVLFVLFRWLLFAIEFYIVDY